MAKKFKKLTREEKRNLRDKENNELETLQQRVKDFDPKQNSNISKFDELPLSKDTLKGLRSSSYLTMTDIQKQSIPVSLKGHDILGAAKTGSGKTLAFLIPVIENLVHEHWNENDGLGALIISPTRELAIQIYEALLKIGKYNTFSAGLVIGGKDYAFEKERIGRVNILIGTPGRILQHMDQSATLNLNNLQMLVLDEADRILDMGFKKTLDNIIGNLPPDRQTLLFSATQTKSVQDLARLSLVNPKYINTSSDDEATTPDSLEQSYIVAPLNEKLNILWSFIKSHVNSKILVFVSSSKQVHFIYESFRKLQPGISLMKLHGRQKQKARLETTVKFTQAQHCCLFATDVVARGLDFPAIDWVVQLDCPEDVSTYIHRVGRCARFGRVGKALLMLTPSEEEPFIKRLESKRVTAAKLNIKGSKKKKIQDQLQSLCFKSPELKYLGQKAFISYFKSIYIQKDKEVFDVTKLPLDDYAKSLGLPGAPKIKLLEKARAGKQNQVSDEQLLKLKEKKNASRQLMSLTKAEENGDIQEDKKIRTKYDKMFERKNQTVLSDHYLKLNVENKAGDDDEEEEDFLSVKRKDHILDESELPELDVNTSKRSMKKALSRKLTAKGVGKGSKMVFDDEGVAHPIYELEDEDDFNKQGADKLKAEFLTKEKELMTRADSKDKDVEKEKRQEKRRRRKELERQTIEGNTSSDEGEPETQYIIGNPSDNDDDVDLDKDMMSDSDNEQEDEPKKRKWFEKGESEEESDKRSSKKGKNSVPQEEVIEYEQPETIEDLEALTERLLQG